jgi:hypothetical protein
VLGDDSVWVKYAKGSELAIWRFYIDGCGINCGVDEPNVTIDTKRPNAEWDYRNNQWYTIGNNRLFFESEYTGISIEYSYSFSNNDNTLTVKGNGLNLTLTKMGYDQMMSQISPALPSGAGRDPELFDGVRSWKADAMYEVGGVWLGDGGKSVYIDAFDKESYWWYTKDGNIVLLDYVSHATVMTLPYTVTMDGRKLTVTVDGINMEYYKNGEIPRGHDPRLVLGADSVWAYQFSTGDIEYYIFNDDGTGIFGDITRLSSTEYRHSKDAITWYTELELRLWTSRISAPFHYFVTGDTLNYAGIHTKMHIDDLFPEGVY